jgi:hypothetical protein
MSTLCVREACAAAGKPASERIRVKLGMSVCRRADGTNEEYALEFVSEPVCRMHGVEMILSITQGGHAADSVPMNYEEERAAARRLFRGWEL